MSVDRTDYNRQALAIIIDTSITGRRVALELERLCHIHGYPITIRLDNGPEMISSALSEWAQDNNVKLEFIEPGKPAQNAYIERFNRTYREEVLDMYIFTNLEMVRIITEKWRHEYNNNRPHMALKGKSPNDYLKQAA